MTKASHSAVLLSVLALLLLQCQAVRRPGGMIEDHPANMHAWTHSKSVSMVLGADGKVHSLERELQSERNGKDVSTVIREGRDGEWRERRITNGRDVQRHLLSDHSWFTDLVDAPVPRSPAPFGLHNIDFFGDAFDRLFGSLIVPSWPSLERAAAAVPSRPDSVTRTVEIAEEDGRRKRREVITRVRDGEVTTEVVRNDFSNGDDSAPRALDRAEAGASEAAASSPRASMEATAAERREVGKAAVDVEHTVPADTAAAASPRRRAPPLVETVHEDDEE